MLGLNAHSDDEDNAEPPHVADVTGVHVEAVPSVLGARRVIARRVPEQQTTRGRLLHREENEFDGAVQLEVPRHRLVLASGSDTKGFRVEGLEPQPSAVGSERCAASGSADPSRHA